MAQVFYNQLSNNRLKNIFLGLLSLSLSTLMIYLFSLSTSNTEPTTIFYELLFISLIGVFIYLLGRIPSGQVIELSGNDTFSTFYKLGRLRLNYRTWDTVDTLTLEQNASRYYCLTIRTVNGQILVLEKHPTLNEAKSRLSEVKRLFE